MCSNNKIVKSQYKKSELRQKRIKFRWLKYEITFFILRSITNHLIDWLSCFSLFRSILVSFPNQISTNNEQNLNFEILYILCSQVTLKTLLVFIIYLSFLYNNSFTNYDYKTLIWKVMKMPIHNIVQIRNFLIRMYIYINLWIENFLQCTYRLL